MFTFKMINNLHTKKHKKILNLFTYFPIQMGKRKCPYIETIWTIYIILQFCKVPQPSSLMKYRGFHEKGTLSYL